MGDEANELAAAIELHAGELLADATDVLADDDIGVGLGFLVVDGVTVLGVVLVDNHLDNLVALAGELLVDELLDAAVVAVLGAPRDRHLSHTLLEE